MFSKAKDIYAEFANHMRARPVAKSPALSHGYGRPSLVETIFAVGDRVEKVTGDCQITGEVRAVFKMANEAVRLVVEHRAEGGGSFLHIYSPKNLRRID
jgi:hypothetical protein